MSSTPHGWPALSGAWVSGRDHVICWMWPFLSSSSYDSSLLLFVPPQVNQSLEPTKEAGRVAFKAPQRLQYENTGKWLMAVDELVVIVLDIVGALAFITLFNAVWQRCLQDSLTGEETWTRQTPYRYCPPDLPRGWEPLKVIQHPTALATVDATSLIWQ